MKSIIAFTKGVKSGVALATARLNLKRLFGGAGSTIRISQLRGESLDVGTESGTASPRNWRSLTSEEIRKAIDSAENDYLRASYEMHTRANNRMLALGTIMIVGSILIVTFFELSRAFLVPIFEDASLLARLYEFVPTVDSLIAWVTSRHPYEIVIGGSVSALMLFAMRGRYLRSYATLEICVGVLSLHSSASVLVVNDLSSAIPLLAGIYIVIRGLDNFAKGLQPDGWLGQRFSMYFNNPPAK